MDIWGEYSRLVETDVVVLWLICAREEEFVFVFLQWVERVSEEDADDD